MLNNLAVGDGDTPRFQHLPLLALSTLPLAAVYLYVLYDAHYRTSPETPRDDSNYPDDDAYDVPTDYVGVSLTVILTIFLGSFVILGNLMAYYGYFISRGLDLLNKYTTQGYVINGNLRVNTKAEGYWLLLGYLQCRFSGRYDKVTYAHPDPAKAGLEGLAANANGTFARSGQEGWIVKKVIRRSRAVLERKRRLDHVDAVLKRQQRLDQVKTKAMHPNEPVPIVLLPDQPCSGLLREDVEYDSAFLTHFRGSKRYTETLIVIAFWMVFTFLSSVYLVVEMGKENVQRDDQAIGIAELVVTVLVITDAMFITLYQAVLLIQCWVSKMCLEIEIYI